jgi:hypothetical protein
MVAVGRNNHSPRLPTPSPYFLTQLEILKNWIPRRDETSARYAVVIENIGGGGGSGSAAVRGAFFQQRGGAKKGPRLSGLQQPIEADPS